MADRMMKLTGQALNLIGHVSPRTAGKLAFDLFCRTDSRKPKSDKEKKLFESSLAKMHEAQLDILPVPGGQVATFVFPPTAAPVPQKVLVVHGWGSRIQYVQNLISAVRATGATVVGLDFPGHGHSTGRSLSVPKALQAIHTAWDRHGPFDAMIGHSFGGYNLVMAAYGAMDTVPAHLPQKLVIIASPHRADSMFKFFGRALGLSEKVQQEMNLEVERISGRSLEQFNAARMLADIKVRALVLHAEDDKEVSAESAKRYAAGRTARISGMAEWSWSPAHCQFCQDRRGCSGIFAVG